MDPAETDWIWVKRYAPLAFCMLFAHAVSTDELLAAYGCDPASARMLTWDEMVEDEDLGDIWEDPGSAPIVRIGRTGDWAFGFEALGLEGARPELAKHLPVGTETVSLGVSGNAFSWFRHAVNGVAITEFEPLAPYQRRGTDPDRLAPQLRRVGLNPVGPIDLDAVDPTVAALDLATTAWGLHISEAMITGPLLSAQTRPWPREASVPPRVATPAVLLEPGRPGPAGSVMKMPPRPS